MPFFHISYYIEINIKFSCLWHSVNNTTVGGKVFFILTKKMGFSYSRSVVIYGAREVLQIIWSFLSDSYGKKMNYYEELISLHYLLDHYNSCEKVNLGQGFGAAIKMHLLSWCTDSSLDSTSNSTLLLMNTLGGSRL